MAANSVIIAVISTTPICALLAIVPFGIVSFVTSAIVVCASVRAHDHGRQAKRGRQARGEQARGQQARHQ